MERRNKLTYWISTGLLSAFMLMNVVVYLVQHAAVVETFSGLGYPAYLIYPLALAKLLGVIAILSRRSKLLKEWAYAGFFFNFLIALSAHLNAGDTLFAISIVAFALLLVSRVYEPKVFGITTPKRENAVMSHAIS